MGLLAPVWESATLRLAAAVVVGALLGLLLSFLVNCTLVEISLNALFAFYFGLVFCVVGGLILVRVCQGRQEGCRRVLLVGFALMVVAAGLVCFLFDEQWLFKLPLGAKLPLYGLLGLSTCFAVTFSVLDLLNLCSNHCSPQAAPLIESSQQVTLVMAASVAMGLGYGLFFAVLDVGKSAKSGADLAHQLKHEELFCIPYGIVLGAMTGGLNELLRARQQRAAEYKYSPLFQDDNDFI